MKFHGPIHAIEAMPIYGMPDETCVESAENAHVDVKRTALLTNNGPSFTRQMLNVIQRREAMQKYAPSAPVLWFGAAQQEQRRVPSKLEYILDVSSAGISGQDACVVLSVIEFAALKTQLAEFMGQQNKVLSEPTLKAFKTLHVPVNRDIVQFGGPARVDIVRADSSYRGESWHSDVSIKAQLLGRRGQSGEGVWFGQVRMLFYASYCSKAAAREATRASRLMPSEGRMALALVRWFDDALCTEADDTGMQQLHWEEDADGGPNSFSVVDIDTIRKTEHIVLDFELEAAATRFHVNHFAFIHQRRGW
jgi:hypothetical protein